MLTSLTPSPKAEERHILSLRPIHGNHWEMLARDLPGRLPSAVKKWWYTKLKWTEEGQAVEAERKRRKRACWPVPGG